MKALILLFLCSNVFATTLVDETKKCPSHQVLSSEESRSVTDLISEPLQVELLEKYELQPQVSFEHQNATISLSKIFSRVSKNRFHVMAFIKIGNEVFPRVIYHSNSHGVYRLIDGIVDGWYSKGPGQNYISIPYNINKFLLNHCISNAPKRTKTEVREFLSLGRDHLYYFNNYGIFSENTRPALEEAKAPLLLDGNGAQKRDPRDIRIKAGFGPDFSVEKARFYTTTKASGVVEVVIYRSMNGKIDYTIMIDKDKKAWISEVNSFFEDINKFGIAEHQYDLKELIQPRWEHPREIVLDFVSSLVSPFRSSYSSNWNYLREIPLIQAWYIFNNIDLPAKEI